MKRIRIKLRDIEWIESPSISINFRWSDTHGINLNKHDRKLRDRIVCLLRSFPTKHSTRLGHRVHSDIFPLRGVSATWW